MTTSTQIRDPATDIGEEAQRIAAYAPVTDEAGHEESLAEAYVELLGISDWLRELADRLDELADASPLCHAAYHDPTVCSGYCVPRS